jgi:hypothetical protein
VGVGLGRVELVEVGGDHRPARLGDPPPARHEAAEGRPVGHTAPEPVAVPELALDHELGEVVRETPAGGTAEAAHRPPLGGERGPGAHAALELAEPHLHGRRRYDADGRQAQRDSREIQPAGQEPRPGRANTYGGGVEMSQDWSEVGDVDRHRLARANRVIRLGFVSRDDQGKLVVVDLCGLDEIDQPIMPDPNES